MLLDLRPGRRPRWSLVALGTIIALASFMLLVRPYGSTVQTEFPDFGSQIAAKLDSFRIPTAEKEYGKDAFVWGWTGQTKVDPKLEPVQNASASAETLWAKLQPLLDGNPPGIKDIQGWDGLDFTDYSEATTEYTEDILEVGALDTVKMRQAHQRFLDGIRRDLPRYIPSSGSAKRGIVTTAGGSYLPTFMVSLRMLRRTGSTLPVEVWMNSPDEYEPYICEEVFPAMNVTCRMLEHIFHHGDKEFVLKNKIEQFQFKIFAILFSGFEEILWLDADDFPLHDPESLFEAEPYMSTGMIIWPDFWYRSISPTYHLINGKDPEHRGVRPAAETGQILLNKATHFQVLLLVAYYNYYGPSHYYGLLCQNGPGRGDKETFVPAAMTLDLPFYQVRQGVGAIGHRYEDREDGVWIFAMIQYDLVQDFAKHSNRSFTHSSSTQTKVPISSSAASNGTQAPRPFFLHCNMPKWNPKHVFDHSSVYDLTWNASKHTSLAFTHPPELVASLNGIERAMWEEVRWTACELEGKFKDWGASRDVCMNVEYYFETYLVPNTGKEMESLS